MLRLWWGGVAENRAAIELDDYNGAVEVYSLYAEVNP